MSFTVEIDFLDGAGYTDVTSKVTARKFKKKEVLHNNLKPVVNTCTFEIMNPQAETSKLIEYSGKKPIRIEADGSPFFTGYIRDTYKTGVIGSPKMKPLKVQIVDPSFRLDQKVKSSFILQGKQLSDTSTPGESILHLLLTDAGFVSGESNISSIAKTIPYLVIEAGEKTYKEVISKLLFDCGYTYNFNAAGQFELVDLFPTDITSTSYIFANNGTVNNIGGELELEKVEEKYEAISVQWQKLRTEENAVVFSDTTGGNDFYKCFIPVAGGDYYPEGAGDRTVYCDYSLNDQDLVLVTNVTKDFTLGIGQTVEEFTAYGKRASLRIKNTSGAPSNITKLQLKGDAVVVAENNTSERWNVANTEKILDYEAEFVNEQTSADFLVNGLASYYKYADVKLKLKSKSNYEIGDAVALDENISDLATYARIIEKVDDLSGTYSYVLEGASDFETDVVVNEAVLSSQPPINYAASREAVIQAIDTGYDSPLDGGGTTTPEAVTLAATGGIRSSALSCTYQSSLRWLDHYEFQVAPVPDSATWYALGSGADWRGAVGETTDTAAPAFNHSDIPPDLSDPTNPLEVELSYRVRQVTKAGTVGPWSNVVTVTVKLIGLDDVLNGSITAPKLAALSVDTSNLTAGALSSRATVAGDLKATEIDLDTGIQKWRRADGVTIFDFDPNRTGDEIRYTGKVTADSGRIGAFTLGTNKAYAGAGVFGGATTPFYADTGGDFSLGDKLKFDYSAELLEITGKLTADSGRIGAFTLGIGKVYMGAGTWATALTPFYADDQGNFSLGNKLYFDYENEVLNVDGIINTSGGAIASWQIEQGLLQSADSGARVVLNATLNRVSIFDTAGEKVVMGFLKDLLIPDTSPAEYYTSADYGFWIAQGNRLVIAGAMAIKSSDLVNHDGNIAIYSGESTELLRMGSDNGAIGYHFYYSASGALSLTAGASSELNVKTAHGYIDIGPKNGTWCHIYTDRGAFYFNKELYVLGSKVWNAGNLINTDGDRTNELDFNTCLMTGFYNVGSGGVNGTGADYTQIIAVRGRDTGLQISGGYNSNELKFRGWAQYGAIWYPWRRIWHDGNHGAGSGLDADLLDGNHASYFAIYNHFRSLGAPTLNDGTTTAAIIAEIENKGGFDSYLSGFKTSWSYANNSNLADAGRLTELAGTAWLTWTDNADDTTRGHITALVIAPNTGGSAKGVYIYNDQGSSYSPGWREIWTSATDGAGSGMDSDKLDGYHAASFAMLTGAIFTGNITISKTNGRVTFDETAYATGNSGLAFQTGAGQNCELVHEITDGELPWAGQGLRLNNTTSGGGSPAHLVIDGNIKAGGGNMLCGSNAVWHAGNVGAGSGLDADKLDGDHASAFMRAVSDGSYYGLKDPGGSAANWIRTTSNGILPYSSGGASALGTSTWWFNSAHIKTIRSTSIELTSDTYQNTYWGRIVGDSTSIKFERGGINRLQLMSYGIKVTGHIYIDSKKIASSDGNTLYENGVALSSKYATPADLSGYAQFSTTSIEYTTEYPIGAYVYVYCSTSAPKINNSVSIYAYSYGGNGNKYFMNSDGGAYWYPLSGTWRACGCYDSSGDAFLARRVA